MKRTRQELEAIENAVKRVYNRPGRRLREITDKVIDPTSAEPLGYSWMYNDPDTKEQVCTVFVSELPGKEETKYRIYIHELCHAYCGHLDNDSYAELDKRIYDVFKNHRGQIIDMINRECNVTDGEVLVNRVLDDPSVNHEIHNIAMDMEVNSKALSREDVKEMGQDVTQLGREILEKRFNIIREHNSGKSEDEKKLLDEALKRMTSNFKVKFISPENYKDTSTGLPFPPGLSYEEYIMMIIRNLPQFVKMMISISNGGTGDTSEVTDEQMEAAFGNGKGMGGGLSDLMNQLGMADNSGQGDAGQGQGQAQGQQGQGQGQQGQGGNGISGHDTSNSGGYKGSSNKTDSEHRGIRNKDDGFNLRNYDHRTPSRDTADKIREAGDISAGGGFGCGTGGSPDYSRNVRKMDPVDEAIEDVIRNTKSKVIKRQVTRNIIRNYNLGKNRSVIVPSILAKNLIDKKPKLVFIIDISGSMDTDLVDRIISTISRKMKSINRDLSYDILTWSTQMGEWIQDIKAGKMIPKIRMGGGTRLAGAIKFIKENYDPSVNFIVCSDFEDYLDEWCNVLKSMPAYVGWGFNYGTRNYKQKWPSNFTVKNFNVSYVGGRRSW